MKKLTSPLVLLGLLALAISGFASALSPTPIAADSDVNNVAVLFHTAWSYESPEDTFISSQVTGRKWWQVSIMNVPDDTRAPVAAPMLSLESALAFDNFEAENLVTSGPPTYEWSFGDITERSDAGVWVDSLHDSNSVPVTFTSGFDASRSVDKTEFSAQGIQTLTITLTPREATEGFKVLVQAEENDIVNPVITSPTSGDGIYLTPDGHSLHIEPTSLEINSTWTINIAIQVTPKVPQVTYMPYVVIEREETVASGSSNRSFISHPVGDPVDNVGTWTWSAQDTYEWNWEERLSKRVIWVHNPKGSGEVNERAISTLEEGGNRIDVSFADELDYEISGNTFSNTEVTGKRRWRTNFTNWPDETGAPVIGLKVVLENELAFDGIERDKLIRTGPPIYEWYLGNVVEEPERQGWAWDAFVTLFHCPTRFSPGLDVSQSFDKTVFTSPDTQTMTVTLTPREEWVETISIFVHTDEYETVNPVIVSISHTGGEEIKIMEDGHRSGIERIPVELNTPLIIIYTLQITPKVASIEYTPNTGIHLYRSGTLAGNTIRGNSFSYTNEAGTWTWSAEGDYVWHWAAQTPDYSVGFLERVVPAMIPDSTPETRRAISWQFIIGLTAGVVVVGSVIYFFIRTRRRIS